MDHNDNRVSSSTENRTIQPLLKRARLFLEDNNLAKADDYCEQVLDMDPENAEAYLIKLMIRAQVKTEDDLAFAKESFAEWNSYKNAMRFADEALRQRLVEYLQSTEDNLRTKEQERLRTAEIKRKSDIYRDARTYESDGKTITNFEKAINLFRKIPDFEDSSARIISCTQQLEALKKEAARLEMERLQKQRRARRKTIAVACILVLVMVVTVILICNSINKSNEEKVAKATAMLAGMSFEGTYTDYTKGPSYDQFGSIKTMTKNEVTYTFLENGQVSVYTKSYHGKGVYYTDKDGNRIWDSETENYTTIPSYHVSITFDGEMSIELDGCIFQLICDSSGTPQDLVYKSVYYTRK